MGKATSKTRRIELSDGTNLPVLDISDEKFTKYSNYETFLDLDRKMDNRGESIEHEPVIIKKFIKRLANTGNDSLSGLTTLFLKLGPELLSGCNVPYFTKWLSKQFISYALRIRLLKLCEMQIKYIQDIVLENPEKNICVINVGGGPSVDSVNVVKMLVDNNPNIFIDRSLEIAIFDRDLLGPEYAKKSFIELVGCDNKKVTLKTVYYDWSKIDVLKEYLNANHDKIIIYVSEGGIFEYGTKEEIIENLNELATIKTKNIVVFGSVVKAEDEINKGYLASSKISGIQLKFWGVKGLAKLIENTSWEIEQSESLGKIFEVFTLRKNSKSY
jgi:hypothetical protein